MEKGNSTSPAAYLTTNTYGLFQIGLVTDGISIPLGVFQYAPNEAWSDDARALLETIDAYIPERFEIILLADRVHTGEPFLSCLDVLNWNYVFRASEDTYVETEYGWKMLRVLDKPENVGIFLSNVRIWKGSIRRTNISIYKQVGTDGRSTTWYLVSSSPACQERFAEYACRWWQECTFKTMKSGLFQWERSRVTDPARVEILWMAMSCAIWVMWILGRTHEHIPQRKTTTEQPQKRRKSIIKQGIAAFYTLCKQGIRIVLIMPERLRMRNNEPTDQGIPRSSPDSDGTVVYTR